MRSAWSLTLLCCALAAGAAPEPCPIPGWRLALQAWTFHQKTLVETLDLARDLGIGYLEAFPGQKIAPDLDEKFQPGLSEAAAERVKAKLAETGIKIVQFGVTGLSNEAGARKTFEFAKQWGIECITSEPDPKFAPKLGQLCDEYGIRVGIHNHPNPNRYWDPAFVKATVDGYSPLLGGCPDTGHWARSGIVPLHGLQTMAGQIVAVHLKDLPKLGEKGVHDVVWGTGVLNLKDVLAELKRQGFQGTVSIEYESWGPTQVDEVRQCVAWFRATAAELAPPVRHASAGWRVVNYGSHNLLHRVPCR